MTDNEDITLLLKSWTAGDAAAGSLLFERLYDDLRAIASRRLQAEGPQLTPQTTVLVHELFLKLIDQRRIDWQGRAQFFAIAARILRRLLVDHARARAAEKRGGELVVLPLDELSDIPLIERPAEILAIEKCLEDLEARDPEKAKLVELRFFAGFSLEETAEILGISRATAVRQWRLVKGTLLRQLRPH